VEATAVAIDTASSALNAVVNTRAVQEIPLNGRDFRQLLYLTPGYNQSGSMNGNRGNQNNWQIDGTDNNDFWHNSEAVNQGSISGVAGVLLPIEAIDQFNQQSGGGADFGRNPGSMVNVALKSGTNEIHGSAYYFNRNEAFASAQPFAPVNAPAKLRNENEGFSLGGPIFKNHTFFFLTYEHQKFIAGNALQATVPSDAWVAQATNVLNKYGIPVNSVMMNVLHTLWPTSIRSAPATAPNYFSSDNNDYRSHNGVIKLDHSFNSNNTLSLRAFLGTGEAAAFAGSVYHDYFQAVPSRQHNFSAIYTSVLGPRLVNQFLAGVNYFAQTFQDVNHGFDMASLGFNTGVTNPSFFGAPNMEITGFNNGGVGETPALGRVDVTGHITDNVSYSFGGHQLKIGGEFRHALLDVFYYRDNRSAFDPWDGTAGPWANDASFNGTTKALADYIAGYIRAGQGTKGFNDPQRDFTVNSYELWVQDNWQVNRKLNLNLGLRYSINGRMYADNISIFDPTNSTGFAIIGKDKPALYPGDYNNFAPRIGIAYTPKRGGKTVIRAAYGVYYDIVNGNLFIDNRAGGDSGRGLSRNPVGSAPAFTATNPNAMVVQYGVPIFGGATASPPYAGYGVSQDLRSPYVQNFNFNVQHQLTRALIVQVGYVGNQARKLIYNENINQALPDPTGTAPRNPRRPYYTQFPFLTGITQIQSGANSHYNAFQTTVRSSLWKGFSGQFSYTLGHAYDVMSNVRNTTLTDNYNRNLNYGNADFDTRHNFSAYLIYDVPQIGHAVPLLTKGWQLNAYITYDSGFPYTMYAGKDISGTNNRADRVNAAGDPFSGIVQPATVNGRYTNGVAWFNPTAFAFPQNGTFGTIARNAYYGPEFKSVDFSMFKQFPLYKERVHLQLRAEIFNIFNSLNLGNPDSTLNSGTSGLIFGTRHGGDAPGIGYGEPRNIQLAAKIVW